MFTRQRSLIIKDNTGYIKIEIDTLKELSFLSCILKCKFLFTPKDFEYNNVKYPTIRIIRGDEDNEHTNCRNGVFSKK